jgi:membrane peptidoglycan carboxypeptidase
VSTVGSRSLIVLTWLCVVAGVLVAGVAAPVVVGMGALTNQVSEPVGALPGQMANVPPPQVTTVTDAEGHPIATLYDQYRLPASWQQISTTMKAATVSIEDRTFFTEPGVDPRSIMRAALHNAGGGGRQGGSTITQQFVKNYLINVEDRHNPRAQEEDQETTMARKLREAKLAANVSARQSKEDILTGYLNEVSFGNQVYGVQAAAKYYFNTTADRLNIEQAALLAGSVDNPNYFNPYRFPKNARHRRDTVIDAMAATRSITPAQAASAKAQPLEVVQPPQRLPSDSCYAAAGESGFFCNYAVSYLEQHGLSHDQIFSGGYTIRTTMDPQISRIAKQTANRRVPPTSQGIANPFVITRPGPNSHQVVAMVSNRDFGTDSEAGQTSYNQPADVSVPFGAGSIFKLFTAAAALEQGKAGLDTPLPNPPVQCFLPPNANAATKCAPIRNDTPNYPNPTVLHQALATSPNVAFTNLELQTGMGNVLGMAYRLGLRQTMQANMHGQSPRPAPVGASNPASYTQPQSLYNLNNVAFTLGFNPFSPLELANVGATLADHGRWCAANPIQEVVDRDGNQVRVPQPPCEQVVPRALADTLVNGMGDDIKPPGTSEAAARGAGWNRPTAAKTGTTENNESVAFLGISNGYAATSALYADGSRPGTICNSNPPVISSGCEGAFGGTLAAPTFFDSFNQILAGQPDQPLPAADPAYLAAQGHGPVVPSVVGQLLAQAQQALARAGYPVRTSPIPANAPPGTVVGQTPQGSVAPGQQVTLVVSTGH